MNKQSPLIDRLPRALKRSGGQTQAPQVPAHIRLVGVNLDEGQRADIRKRLGVKLGKYATAIERVSVRVEDVNGPRGGVDKICRIKVVLSALASVVFASQASSLTDAVNGALAGTERSVRRSVGRRAGKAGKPGASGSAPSSVDEHPDEDP